MHKKHKIEDQRQKRGASYSPEIKPETSSSSRIWLPQAAAATVPVVPARTHPLPPINTIGIKSNREILKNLKNFMQNYKFTSMNNVWKINMPGVESYRKISIELNNKRYQWYTYEDIEKIYLEIFQKLERSEHPKK